MNFTIKFQCGICIIFSILVWGGVCSSLICVLIICENLEATAYAILIISIVVFGGAACFYCYYGLFKFKIRQKVILTEDYIQIKTFYILPCLNKNEIYNYMNLKKFKVEKVTSQDGDSILYHIP